MFYRLSEKGKEEITIDGIEELNNEKIVGYLSLDEFENNYMQFGFLEATILQCKTEQDSMRSSIDLYDNYSFGIITVIEPTAIQEQVDKVAFYIKKNLFLLVKIKDDNGSVLDCFTQAISKVKQGVTLEKIIYCFMEKLISNDSKILESISKKITTLEEMLINNEHDNSINRQIFRFKKELLVFKNYYDQLIDIGEALQENENNLWEENDELRYFKIFTNKVTRLKENILSLTEMTIHLRETYEACIDLNLNRIMKIFTVVTTVFLPLTLIVGWYGMNFKYMPELSWKYGYFATIIACILVVIVCFLFFKKKEFI